MVGACCAACGKDGATACCPHCRLALYCDTSCMDSHWPVHKCICRAAMADGSSSGAAAAAPCAVSHVATRSGPGPPSREPFSAPDIAEGARALLRESGGARPGDEVLRQLAGSAPAGKASSFAYSVAVGTGGLRALAAAGETLAAEEAWALQQEAGGDGGGAARLPQLHALVTAEIASEECFAHFVACVQSICKQWRAPPECTVVGWHAQDGELRAKTASFLADFERTITSHGPFIAYMDGPVRAVKCRVITVEHPTALTHGEHLRKLLDLVPQADNAWVMFSEDDGLWHPGRTAFWRNLTRQVPGPEQCHAAAAPILARATAAGGGQLFGGALEVNRLLQGGDPGVELREETCHLTQLCARRSLVAAFFECHSDAVVQHGLFHVRLMSFIVCEHGQRCQGVSAETFKQGQQTPHWMYFRRRPEAGPSKARPDPGLGAEDAERMRALLEATKGAASPGTSAADVEGLLVALRESIDHSVLRNWDRCSVRELADTALENVDPLFTADTEMVSTQLRPMAERLIIEARVAFGVPDKA
mmetsp:Transcript_76435/g.216101  ORF Transcript_76435/g.216101 Transcript_76435/m.216101 type:complete len:535 (-) Transcript_76435:82-1686(-)